MGGDEAGFQPFLVNGGRSPSSPLKKARLEKMTRKNIGIFA
jgi:hypothetical protein